VDNSLRLSQNRTVGALNTGVYMQETRPAFGQGDLKVTNNQTDVAIQEGSMPTDPDTNQKGTVMFPFTPLKSQLFPYYHYKGP